MIFNLLVSGRVQGVNFRRTVRDYCLLNGIKGIVRNLDDGRVEIIVQCSENEKAELIKWLKSNPGLSKVADVKSQEMKIKKKVKFNGFEVVRDGNFLKDQVKSAKNLGKEILKL